MKRDTEFGQGEILKAAMVQLQRMSTMQEEQYGEEGEGSRGEGNLGV